MACMSAESDPPFYLDARCKFSKKEGLSRSRSSSQSLMKNSSQRSCGLTRKCTRMVKELRARFYIIRRCIAMLICWNDYTDS